MAEVKGKIILKNDTEQVSDSFCKREFVVETNEQYPQKVLIQFVQDKCDILNNFNVGDDVEVGVNIQGREWVSPQGETKYFNTIQGWKINKQGAAQQTQQAQQAPPTPPQEDDEPPFS